MLQLVSLLLVVVFVHSFNLDNSLLGYGGNSGIDPSLVAVGWPAGPGPTGPWGNALNPRFDTIRFTRVFFFCSAPFNMSVFAIYDDITPGTTPLASLVSDGQTPYDCDGPTIVDLPGPHAWHTLGSDPFLYTFLGNPSGNIEFTIPEYFSGLDVGFSSTVADHDVSVDIPSGMAVWTVYYNVGWEYEGLCPEIAFCGLNNLTSESCTTDQALFVDGDWTVTSCDYGCDYLSSGLCFAVDDIGAWCSPDGTFCSSDTTLVSCSSGVVSGSIDCVFGCNNGTGVCFTDWVVGALCPAGETQVCLSEGDVSAACVDGRVSDQTTECQYGCGIAGGCETGPQLSLPAIIGGAIGGAVVLIAIVAAVVIAIVLFLTVSRRKRSGGKAPVAVVEEMTAMPEETTTKKDSDTGSDSHSSDSSSD